MHWHGLTKKMCCVRDDAVAGNVVKSSSHQSQRSSIFDAQTSKRFIPGLEEHNLQVFKLNEIELITRNFRMDYLLGENGFWRVHKGHIDDNVREGFKGMPVAVKVLNQKGIEGNREWMAEKNYLAQLRHPHLVKLVGYCCEEEDRVLVYEFMPGNSLEHHLFGKISIPLPWSARMKIAVGAAKGLAFLHGAQKPVIHRDFKTYNILLDTDYTVKLFGLGLAMDAPKGDEIKECQVFAPIRGTYGYAAPEYVATGLLTTKIDVYAFGVVLLELLTGRRSMDKRRTTRERNLVEWARPHLLDGRMLKRIMDPRLEGQYSVKAAKNAARLAEQCLCYNPKSRPLTKDIVMTLEPLQNMRDTSVTDKQSYDRK